MKKFLLALVLMVPMLAWSQDNQPHIKFMGIELGQDSTVFASELIAKGFTPITADGGKWRGFKGNFWELTDCNVVLHADINKKIESVGVVAKEADYGLMSPLFKDLTAKYNGKDPTFIENSGDWFKCMWLAGAGVIEMNCMGSPVNIFELTYYDSQAALKYLNGISSKYDDL